MSYLQQVICPHCQKLTEVIPGAMIAECDECHHLFQPQKAVSVSQTNGLPKAQEEAFLTGIQMPGVATEPLGEFTTEPVKEETLPWEKPDPLVQQPEPDGFTPERSESIHVAQKLPEISFQEELTHSSPQETHVTPQPQTFDEEFDEDTTTLKSQNARSRYSVSHDRKQKKSASVSFSVVVFFIILALAIWGYYKAQQTNIAKPRHAVSRQPHSNVRGQQKSTRKTTSSDPAPQNIKKPSALQQLGKKYLHEQGILLTPKEQGVVQEMVHLAQEQNLYRWGLENAQVRVLIFAPLTYIGIARLKQFEDILFKNMAPFQNDMELFLIFHWGGESNGVQEGTNLLYLVQEVAGTSQMMNALNVMMKNNHWRMDSLRDGFIKALLSELGISLEDQKQIQNAMKQNMNKIEEIKNKIMQSLEELHLKLDDLTFVIQDRKYNNGDNLYRIHHIIDYILFLLSQSKGE